MLMNGLLILAGILLLAYAGSRLVDFAAALAARARVTPAVIGLTVVAAGTSMPELFVSATAALNRSSDIALANVVGSNSANVGLVLGASALLSPLPLGLRLLRFEYPFMLLSSALLILLGRDGWIDRVEGGFFLAAMVAFTAFAVWLARREITSREKALLAERVAHGGREPALEARPPGVLFLGLVASLAGLSIGARLLVSGAVDVARAWGLSERIVGLTIVAVGTSLPELVASLAAAARRQHEMAVANVVGSNIFNILMILGPTALLRPIAVSPALVVPDMVVMIGLTALIFPLAAPARRLTRPGGAFLLLLYVAYMMKILRAG